MDSRLSRDEIDTLARARWGDPNRRMSRPDELRFGNHGSKRVNLETGAWADFETGEDGIFRQPLPTPRELWDQAHQLQPGSLAWSYWVETRCCCVFPGLDVREHGALWYDANRPEVPGLVAAVRNASGAFAAIHRTFLDRHGRKLDRKAWGPVSGGHIVIHDPGEHALPGHLLVGEGLESTASAAAEHPECVAWSALSAGGVRGLAPPAGISHLVVAPDMDEAGVGQRAAHVLAQRARARGITVEVLPSLAGRKDWNDAHMAQRQPAEPPRFGDDYEATTRRIAEAELNR